MVSRALLFMKMLVGTVLLAAVASVAQPFYLPTANQAIFQRNGYTAYFVPTTGRTWESGTFGCVRSEGWQMHEGIDIKCVQRGRNGEPLDPIMATAEGTVAYLNTRESLSNYGKYIILQHVIDCLEVYALYAHLSEIRDGLRIGQRVRAREVIGTMGCTANTREKISHERAHLHFEVNFLANDRFVPWHQKEAPGERNDHGVWNGQNLVGVDPRMIFLLQRREGARFSLQNYVRGQTELCRVFVRKTSFPWLRRYPQLIVRNPRAEKEGVAGYEISLNFNGVPFRLIPRARSELKGTGTYQLLWVNAAEQKRNPARRLVVQKGNRWELGSHGLRWLDLLTY